MRNTIVILPLALLFSVASASAEPLRIGYNQWAGFGPVFVVKEKGFFEDEGIVHSLSRIQDFLIDQDVGEKGPYATEMLDGRLFTN